MIIYLVRHGETVLNGKPIHQGQLDTDLTEKGIKQAKLLGNRFKEITDFEVVYSSNLKRAVLTAKEIAKFHKGVDLIEDGRFQERSHGDFAGKEYGIYDTLENKCKVTRTPPNGENFNDQIIRVERALKEILEKKQNCVIVSHGGTIRVIMYLLNLFDKETALFDKSIKPKNTTVYKFKINDSNVDILIENCIKHLEELN